MQFTEKPVSVDYDTSEDVENNTWAKGCPSSSKCKAVTWKLWQETWGEQIWGKNVYRSKRYYCWTQKITSQTESGSHQLFEE